MRTFKIYGIHFLLFLGSQLCFQHEWAKNVTKENHFPFVVTYEFQMANREWVMGSSQNILVGTIVE